MTWIVSGCVVLLVELLRCDAALLGGFRPPCVPLNVISPYQSVWSCSDRLYDSWPQFWTGDDNRMQGFIKVDGVIYRFLGANFSQEKTVSQTSLVVEPATTTYIFKAGGVELVMKFVTTGINLDENITSASRPVTHVSTSLQSSDSALHDVEMYFDQSAQGAVIKDDSEAVSWSRLESTSLEAMKIGTVSQKILDSQDDRINWGHSILAASRNSKGLHTAMAGANYLRTAFFSGSYFNATVDDKTGPRSASNNWPCLSVGWSLGKLSGTIEERHFMLAYDQILSVRYFGTNMMPLWRSHWQDVLAMLEDTEARQAQDITAAASFDKALVQNLTRSGGDAYATLSSLVYRQVIGAAQAVWNPVAQKPWVFIKEISSDGDVSTVDVLSPASPLFLYLYPEYLRLMSEPLMVYANNGTKSYGLDIPYNLSWAPHHLGPWPVCDLKPEDQEQMPVEESGNMLILLASLFQQKGDLSFLDSFWPLLQIWADFLITSLPDPGNQLCTDDFEGPSPHNVNLAAKGIIGLDAYALLLKAKGDEITAAFYQQKARTFAKAWKALADDGDHYRIQFNLPNSWSQKYNLMWQDILGLSSFEMEVLKQESQYYSKKMDPCGIRLDDRHSYSTVDHLYFSATFASDDEFKAIAQAVYRYANTTESRVPLSDWYDTLNCKSVGFRARPVLGGVYAKALSQKKKEGKLGIRSSEHTQTLVVM